MNTATPTPTGADTMTATMYHASPHAFAAFRDDVCCAYDADEATPYVADGGYLYTIAVAGRLADEDDIAAAANALGIDASYTFELADDSDVQAALIAEGFAGCTYDDMGPDNAYEHETVRIFCGASITILDVVNFDI